MRGGWHVLSLGHAPLQIIDGDRGKAYPKHGDFSDEGHCLFLSATNVTISGLEFSECQFISEQKDDELRKGKLTRNDVVLTTRGTLGNAALYGDNIPYDHVRINSGMVIMRTDPTKLLPAFLYGFLRSPSFEGQVEQLRSGVAQPQLPIRDLSKIEMPIPPKAVQERIVDTFGAYDDLIDNNRRRMALLEEAARQLYREWFVRLRFPGREHTRVTNGIPEGWEKLPIEKVCARITDGSHSSPKSVDEGYPMASVKDMDNWGFLMDQCRKISEDDYANLVRSDCKPRKNDVLIAKDGSYLKHTFVVGEEHDLVILSSIAILRPNKRIQPNVLNFILRDPQIKARMEGYVSGVALPRIILKEFRKFEILVPPAAIQREWCDYVDPIVEMCRKLDSYNKWLRKARDLLLPRLISGEVAA